MPHAHDSSLIIYHDAMKRAAHHEWQVCRYRRQQSDDTGYYDGAMLLPPTCCCFALRLPLPSFHVVLLLLARYAAATPLTPQCHAAYRA